MIGRQGINSHQNDIGLAIAWGRCRGRGVNCRIVDFTDIERGDSYGSNANERYKNRQTLKAARQGFVAPYPYCAGEKREQGDLPFHATNRVEEREVIESQPGSD